MNNSPVQRPRSDDSAPRARAALVEVAMALPTATPSDFVTGRPPQGGVATSRLKLARDPKLRTQLIAARIAEPLQIPRGRQQIAPIILLHPDGDAPKRETKPQNPATNQAPADESNPRGLPTIEAMEKLIAKLRMIEDEVARERAVQVYERIAELKRCVQAATDGDLEHLHRELGVALDERRAFAHYARVEAFRRAEHDLTFSERVHLRVLARP